jgi:Glycosyltransferase family 87
MEETQTQTTGPLPDVVQQSEPQVLFFGKGGMSKEQKIRYLSVVILVGFAAAVFFHYVLGAYLALPYPYDTFLFRPTDRFNDFFNMYKINTDLNPYFAPYFIHSNYYPVANFIFYLFTFIPSTLSFLLFTSIFVISFLCLNIANLKVEHRYEHVVAVFVFSFLTYPFLFTVDRGNIEGLLFVFLYAFVYFKDKRPVVSSFALSMAIAMKLYPAVFVVLLLSERKYRAIALTMFGVVIATFACMLLLKGGVGPNLQFILSGFGINESSYFANNNSVLAGVSLFSPIKILLRAMDGAAMEVAPWGQLLGIYSLVVFACFGLLASYILVIERVLWKKVALLVFAMLLFPNVSFDYKLMLTFLPLYLFLKSDSRSKSDRFYASAFALLLIPKGYFFFPQFVSNSGASDIGIAVFVNPAIMVAILTVIVASGVRNWANTLRRNSVITGEP